MICYCDCISLPKVRKIKENQACDCIPLPKMRKVKSWLPNHACQITLAKSCLPNHACQIACIHAMFEGTRHSNDFSFHLSGMDRIHAIGDRCHACRAWWLVYTSDGWWQHLGGLTWLRQWIALSALCLELRPFTIIFTTNRISNLLP